METPRFSIARHLRPCHDGEYVMSEHALCRMWERALSPEDVRMTLIFGEPVFDRGALIFRVGRRQVARFRERGVDLAQLEGLQVVCSVDRTVMTVYRNHEFRTVRKTHKPSDRPPARNVFRDRE
jgi:hypothetical protein